MPSEPESLSEHEETEEEGGEASNENPSNAEMMKAFKAMESQGGRNSFGGRGRQREIDRGGGTNFRDRGRNRPIEELHRQQRRYDSVRQKLRDKGINRHRVIFPARLLLTHGDRTMIMNSPEEVEKFMQQVVDK
ncbi:hypothetical protein F2P79_023218 [Pimephales promelas]|nr:hypothetical protein F2P79_023218 [Pimephales promelas]